MRCPVMMHAARSGLYLPSREPCTVQLCSFLYTLSQLFNQFYEHCPILKLPAGGGGVSTASEAAEQPEKVRINRILISMLTRGKRTDRRVSRPCID